MPEPCRSGRGGKRGTGEQADRPDWTSAQGRPALHRSDPRCTAARSASWWRAVSSGRTRGDRFWAGLASAGGRETGSSSRPCITGMCSNWAVEGIARSGHGNGPQRPLPRPPTRPRRADYYSGVVEYPGNVFVNIVHSWVATEQVQRGIHPADRHTGRGRLQLRHVLVPTRLEEARSSPGRAGTTTPCLRSRPSSTRCAPEASRSARSSTAASRADVSSGSCLGRRQGSRGSTRFLSAKLRSASRPSTGHLWYALPCSGRNGTENESNRMGWSRSRYQYATLM